LDTDRDLFAAQVTQLQGYAVFFIDAGGVLRTWNAGVERLFGYSASDWVGQHASLIFTPADRAIDLCDAELGIARDKGTASDIRWHRKKDGTELFALGVLETVVDSAGNLLGYTKVISDETDRKRLEDSLIQMNVALEHFAYAASHDLQEPLRTVRTFAQLLLKREGNSLSSEGREYLNYIIPAVARMSNLVADLLAYAKSGVEKQSAVSISLDDEVEAAVSQLRAAMDETGATVTHDPLPTVTVEHTQVTRLFLNLISNAIKYRTAERKPHIHILAVGVENDIATIAVRDNGIGFRQEYAESIFEPFTRLQRDQESGSGVGLAICRRIVERSGGRIWAESTPGEGSTFFFTLPVARES
jgi:PAS domain S-box-containing protein